LVSRIGKICRDRSRPFFDPIEYRLKALKGIWKGKDDWQKYWKDKKRASQKISTQGPEKSRRDNSNEFVESELSLMLIVCLLESQSRTDPSLTGVTTKLLSDHFRNRSPISRSIAQPKHLDSLENLLRTWLEVSLSVENASTASLSVENAKVEETATALVTLACSYDSRATLIRTIHVLKNIEAKNIENKNNECENIENKNFESENVKTKGVECLLDVRDVIDVLLSVDEDQVCCSVIKSNILVFSTYVIKSLN
jgi:hypothetical protein